MTHNKAFSDLRVGATVILRDWRGDTAHGQVFLSPSGAWLMRTLAGAVFPVTPRELIHVAQGAAETFSKLREGAAITIADWTGQPVEGIAQCNRAGLWECRDHEGARWIIEPYRLATIQEG